MVSKTSPLLPRFAFRTLRILSWGEVHHALSVIARAMEDDAFEPDIIVGVRHGGTLPAKLLGRMLGKRTAYVKHRYLHQPILARVKPDCQIERSQLRKVPRKGKYLIVDDVCQTGETLLNSWNKLREKGCKGETRYAAIVKRSDPDCLVELSYYCFESSLPVRFPWDLKSGDARSPFVDELSGSI